MNLIVVVILSCIIRINNGVYYNDRDGQPHFDPEAHGLPKEELNEDMSWGEIFADEIRDSMNREKMIKPSFMREDEDETFNGHFEVVHDWPNEGLPIGEVGGLATDEEGRLHVFHRGDRIWSLNSFNEFNLYEEHNKSMIKTPTMLILNISDGEVLGSWGSNLFVLPHGIEIDQSGNVFVTDVALHQVFMFERGKHFPSLVIGEAFRPAESYDDDARFCKPTDVATASNGNFYVSDGYCLSRIMVFDKKGNLLQKFGKDDSEIPHGLALAEDLGLLCVADREGMRVLCYDAGLKDFTTIGSPVAQFTSDDFGRVYGITYSPIDGLLYGILGRTGGLKSQGFTVDLKDEDIYESDVIAYWSPDDEGFANPHAIAVSRDGSDLFIGEISPNFIWKFEKDY